MRHPPFRRLFAAVLALGFALVGAVPVLAACGGRCCGSARAPDRQAVLAAPHTCCCGAVRPCDLEQAKEPRLPEAAASAAPSFSARASVAVPAAPWLVPAPAAPLARHHRGPPSQAPPGPLYLQHLSLRC